MTTTRAGAAGVLLLLATLAPPCGAAAPTKHYFFDEEDIAAKEGVEIRLHRPRETEAFAVRYDSPWENLRTFGYNSVIDNGTHVLLCEPGLRCRCPPPPPPPPPFTPFAPFTPPHPSGRLLRLLGLPAADEQVRLPEPVVHLPRRQ